MGQFLWDSLQETRSLYSILDQRIKILISTTRLPDSNVIEATSEWRKIVKLEISSFRTDLFRAFDRLNQFDLLSSRLDQSESEIVTLRQAFAYLKNLQDRFQGELGYLDHRFYA
jgi:hypothetical protein